MADSVRKASRPRVRPQPLWLNILAAVLVAAVIVQPSWYLVVVAIAELAALGFHWTQEEPFVPDESKRVEELASEVKTLSIRLGNLAFKTGFKEK